MSLQVSQSSATSAGRLRVRVVCIDLSSSYRSLIKRCFPNARIVADRFHFVRIVQYHFMELFRSIAGQIHHQRPILAALRKRPENLSVEQHQRLQELFANHPALKVLYEKMHELRRLLNRRAQRSFQLYSWLPEAHSLSSRVSGSSGSEISLPACMRRRKPRVRL